VPALVADVLRVTDANGVTWEYKRVRRVDAAGK
jgi:hypothetical protein